MMTLGAIGMLNTWILGPAKGLLAAANKGDLPPFFRKTNQKNMPTNILLIQAIISNVIAIVILFEPTINASYWMLYNLTAIIYLFLYLLLFSAAIYLRYKKPDIERHFKIPFKNVGMWILSISGLLTTLFALIVGFFPPSQIKIGPIWHEVFLLLGIIFLIVIPFIFYKLKHKRWKAILLQSKGLCPLQSPQKEHGPF